MIPEHCMRRQAHCRQPLVFLFSVPFVESSDTVLAVQSMRHGHLWASSIRVKRHGNMSVASFASFSSRFSLSDCVFFCLPLDPLPSPLISCLWVLGVCSREDPALGVITISSIARHGRLPARLQRKVSRDGLGEDPDLWVRVVTAIGRVLICLSFHGPFFRFVSGVCCSSHDLGPPGPRATAKLLNGPRGCATEPSRRCSASGSVGEKKWLLATRRMPPSGGQRRTASKAARGGKKKGFGNSTARATRPNQQRGGAHD
ncbi:hypothetical protein BS50DRAFT_51907 [Corynespora cassiicola Philippines]|uniref:Uncharacterized protein n=1 Tax=Corynespora cassiicola Philippines TaxID=1448308 RepID=A0A2T2NIA6_CORCC|nr:hypothetical protein BS50DRAFT_51907 [Corynespora cassiicola Philippines]